MYFRNQKSGSERTNTNTSSHTSALVLSVKNAVDEFFVKLRPLAALVWRTSDILRRAAVIAVVVFRRRTHSRQLVAKFFRHSVRDVCTRRRVVRFAVLATVGNHEASGTPVGAVVRRPVQTAAVRVVGDFPGSVPDPRGTAFNVFRPVKSLRELTVLQRFAPLVSRSFLPQCSLHEFTYRTCSSLVKCQR